MAEENKTVDTNQVEQTEQVEITQDQLDTAVAKRLKRERETFAKRLGIETYNEENVESFMASIKSKDEKIAEYEQQNKDLQTEMLDRDYNIKALQSGVDTDNIERAIKLAKLEVESDPDLDLDKAFNLVLETFPMLKSTPKKPTVKIGDEVSNEVDTKTEVDRYNEKYKNSKYYKG